MIAVLSTRMVPYMKQPLIVFMSHMAGTDPGFQVRRGVFRVKNHDFTPKNLIFSNFRGFARPWIRPCINLQSYFYRVQVLYSHSRKNYLVLTVNARLLSIYYKLDKANVSILLWPFSKFPKHAVRGCDHNYLYKQCLLQLTL